MCICNRLTWRHSDAVSRVSIITAYATQKVHLTLSLELFPSDSEFIMMGSKHLSNPNLIFQTEVVFKNLSLKFVCYLQSAPSEHCTKHVCVLLRHCGGGGCPPPASFLSSCRRREQRQAWLLLTPGLLLSAASP